MNIYIYIYREREREKEKERESAPSFEIYQESNETVE